MARKPATWSDQMNGSMTIEQGLKAWDRALLAAGRSDPTRKAYTFYINRYIRYLNEQGMSNPRVAQLCPENVHGFVAWLKVLPPVIHRGRIHTRGPQAIHAHVITLKTFGRFLLEHGVFKTDPLSVVKNPKLPKTEVEPFTRDEIRLMMAAASEGSYATRNRAVLYFMLATGCRAGEVCGLRLKDIDLKTHVAVVWGKGSKQRTVQFDRVTARHVALWLAERPPSAPDGRVFVSNQGGALTVVGLYHLVHSVGERAGVENAHPHRWRHSFATGWLEAHPGQVFQLQVLLGHTGLEMTRRYVRVTQARMVLDGPSVIELMGLR